MNRWPLHALSAVLELQRGHDLPTQDRVAGDVPIIGSFGVTGRHIEAKYSGPGVAIGRSGASIGTATYVDGPYWPLNTCLFVRDFKGNDERWVYHLLDSIDFAAFNSGSAQPSLNRNFLRDIPVAVPPVSEQQAIAEVLGSLSENIAANTKVSESALQLSSAIYSNATLSAEMARMSDLLTPVLGGTPARGNLDFWGGPHFWASAKDITGAKSDVVIATEESITDLAISDTKATPLPAGSVILTARGTVGKVARLAVPASFNQSCYGFVPGEVPASILYFGILNAMHKAKKIAHGSVFDTITMRTFDHLDFPVFERGDAEALEREIAPLLATVVAKVKENATLAELRDTLLPELMTGRLRVEDIESAATNAV